MRGAAEEFGPYVVYEQIGLGGMATVHRAETQGIAGFSKQVALKRMLPNVAADAKLVQSFIREARLASHLRHANVAQTYDLGKVGDTYFIAMELVPGRNLLAILKHCAAAFGHMPLPIAMNIVNQIADALDYAHNLCDETGTPLGIIHRDVSPANIIVSDGGIVKLIDFGIAKASAAGMQTMSGTVKGKFSYMAPECLLGDVDARSDLFALGVIAHELLSNRPLFQGTDDMDTLYRVKDMPILPPSRINSRVPLEIDAIIMTALERDPEKRWQRATAMRQALTTETQRLGLVAHNAQVEEWLMHAFTAPVHEDEEPSIVVSRHNVELAQGTVPEDFLAQAAEEAATIVNPTGSKQMQAQPEGWKIGTDVSTIDEKPALLAESTITDAEAVSVFDKPTVAAEINPMIASDWNAPSSVETMNDRPPLNEWSAQSSDETREVTHSAMAEHIERSRSSSPHVVQRSTGSNPARTPSQPPSNAARSPSQPPPRATPPNMASQPPPRSTPPNMASQPPPRSTPPPMPSQPPPRMTPPPMRATPPQMPVSYDTTPTTQQKPVASDSAPTLPQALDAKKRSSAQLPPQRPSAQLPSQRPSAQLPSQRPSAPALTRPSSPPSDPRTAPRVEHLPIGVPSSGARTMPMFGKQDDEDAATTAIAVGRPMQSNVGAVLDDLEDRSTVAPSPVTAARTRAEPPPRGLAAGNFLLALLVLIAAGGAAAVVYFALPYLT